MSAQEANTRAATAREATAGAQQQWRSRAMQLQMGARTGGTRRGRGRAGEGTGRGRDRPGERTCITSYQDVGWCRLALDCTEQVSAAGANGACEWRVRVACASGVCEWRVRVACASHLCEWRVRVARASGVCEWRVRVARATGRVRVARASGVCEWRVEVAGASGVCEWRVRVACESGVCEWRMRDKAAGKTGGMQVDSSPPRATRVHLYTAATVARHCAGLHSWCGHTLVDLVCGNRTAVLPLCADGAAVLDRCVLHMHPCR
ncbi:unnamed protein product [Closterium sp. Naga37s-1]|nr:unnamed protein product [Closterium sp. Naga37s-1]